jgi:hypothetical protein
LMGIGFSFPAKIGRLCSSRLILLKPGKLRSASRRQALTEVKDWSRPRSKGYLGLRPDRSGRPSA